MDTNTNSETVIQLSKRYLKFIIIENAIGPMVSNIFINGTITWFVFKSAEASGIAVAGIKYDLLSTAFLLPFITIFLAYAVVGKQVRSGKLQQLSSEQILKKSKISRHPLVRGLLLGSIGIVLFAIPLIWMMSVSQSQTVPVMSYVYFKGFWCGAMALVLSPVAGWWALVNASVGK